MTNKKGNICMKSENKPVYSEIKNLPIEKKDKLCALFLKENRFFKFEGPRTIKIKTAFGERRIDYLFPSSHYAQDCLAMNECYFIKTDESYLIPSSYHPIVSIMDRNLTIGNTLKIPNSNHCGGITIYSNHKDPEIFEIADDSFDKLFK